MKSKSHSFCNQATLKQFVLNFLCISSLNAAADSAGLWWSIWTYISNKLCVETNVAGPVTHFK